LASQKREEGEQSRQGDRLPCKPCQGFANASQGAWIGTIKLRAERAGSGDGRAYTIDAMAFDSQNNVSLCSCVVVVPHDRRPSEE
jgi:hypothetical protein